MIGFRRPTRRPTLWRRAAAAMAVAALLFAAAIGTGSAPAAAPAAPMVQSAAAHHGHAMPAFSQGDTEATAMAAHHPGVMTPSAPQPQLAQTDAPTPASPCEKGCMACQHCGFCTIATLQAPSATPILYRMSYAMVAAVAPASVTPALPAEPPRV